MQFGAKVITIGELSEYLRVHRSTLYRLLKNGQLAGFKIGSDWRFNVETIDQWRMRKGARLSWRSYPEATWGMSAEHSGGYCISGLAADLLLPA